MNIQAGAWFGVDMEKIKDIKRIERYIKKFDLKGVIKDDLVNRIELHRYRRGEIILHMEDEFKYLYFLVEGRVLIHLNTFEGKEMHLDFGDPLELLGDIEFVTSSGIYSNVEAVRESSLLALPKEYLVENARENHRFYELISECLGKKLMKTSKKHTEMILYPLKERIATYLHILAEEDDIIRSFRRSEVALSYGISERHLRRVLSELEDEGIISKRRGSIEIVDRDKLKKYVIE